MTKAEMQTAATEKKDDSQATSPVLVSEPDIIENSEDIDFVVENVRTRVSMPVWVLIIITVLSSTFLFSLDNTIVADIQPAVIKTLGEVDKLSWLGVAFVLASSSTITTWGKLYGIFSVKWLYIGSIVIFEAGSALCGGAPTMNAMIVGRAIAGCGGAGMYVGCLTLLSLTTSVRERPNYMAFIGFTWGSGTVLGPVVGGAFADNHSATWRWAFYINLCIGAAFAPVYLLLLPRADPQPSTSLMKKLKQLDYHGIILNVGAFTALIMAINFGGNLFAWNNGREIALWVVGGVLLLMFVLQQRFKIGTTKLQRTFPADFLNMKIMWILFFLMSAAATCVFVPTFYIPLYFQFVRGDSPLAAGVRLLPFIVLMVFFGLVNGAMMSLFGYYMPWYLAGGILTTIGGSLMRKLITSTVCSLNLQGNLLSPNALDTVNENTSTSKVYGFIVLIGIGAGMFIQASFSVAQAKVTKARAADAAGFIALAQNLGIALALAISGSIFQNKSIDGLRSILPGVPIETVRNAVSGANSDLFENLAPEMRDRVLAVIVHAMSSTYVLVISAGALAIVGSLFMSVSVHIFDHLPGSA
ncbi:hypothetical protein MMC08_006017 [Hypocenomyce scalaris]|nr:hypothetical protein [Hypocenomyce scalaris]